MLESLRHWASGWVASILIGLLILSFAIWGIADVFTGQGGRWLAKVGSQEISSRDFQRAFQDELQGLSERAGQRISVEQARAIGVDREVLDRLAAMSAIESHAVDLGLGLSDATLVENLKKEPMFQGLDGKFSRERFNGLLRQYGLSEKGLLDLRRRDILRSGILKALEASTVIPAPLVDVVHQWREETRKISYTTIDPAKVLKLKDPTEEDLKKYYEDNKSRYMSEPLRELNILLLAIDALKKKVKVPDEKVKEVYEQTKDTYDRPEKRRVQQIAFPDVDAAKAAKEDIKGGMSFADAAKKAGAKESDINLGLVTRSSLIDSKIAEAVFSLKKDEVSDVVEGQFATVLLLVTEIQPGKKSTFASSKGDVRAKLAAEMAREQVLSVYAEIDDGIASGRTLEEISASLDLPFFHLFGVDRNNKTAEGGIALRVKDASKIIAAGFEGEVGVEQEPLQLSDGGYAWVEVLSTTPSKQKSFEEVKDAVKASWIENQRRKKLSEIAAELVKRIKSGESLEVIAKEVGGKVETTELVTRASIPDGLTEAVMTQAFVIEKGAASSAETRDGNSRTIFQVVEIVPAAKPTKEQLTALENELKSVLRREQSEQYVKGLESRYGLQINEELFKQLTGAEAQ